MIQGVQSWADLLREGVVKVRAAKRGQTRVDDWFFVQELRMEEQEAMCAEGLDPCSAMGQAELLCRIARRMPLSLMPGSAIAGSQDGAFSPSYALINPTFKVETFAGYCDPTAIYDDIAPEPARGLSAERIERVRRYWEKSAYVQRLQRIYAQTGDETREVVYFVEPVTGHIIPDMRPALAKGIRALQAEARASGEAYGEAMAVAMEAAVILAARYRALAQSECTNTADEAEKERLQAMADALTCVPAQGAADLHQAVQAFALLWQVMVLEQAPNPYAISAGNIDRVLEPYWAMSDMARAEAVEWVRHLLCFFQVGNRCWAISQNVLVAGRDQHGRDLTCDMTGIVLDAFFASNDPQPALSVKVHKNSPAALYEDLGRFFFTPGHSTPSLFNDDTMFTMLQRQGVASEDLPDYAIAGCQEPLIMGKSSLNTTNTWLNLAKVLELTLNDGQSMISGKAIGPSWEALGYADADAVYADLESAFFSALDAFLPRMAEAGNACTEALGTEKPVPFTSALMDGFHTWRDQRNPEEPGTRYHASGCLIHGLSVVADSLHATSAALASRQVDADRLRQALASDFAAAAPLQSFLTCQDKFGNGCDEVDAIAVRLAEKVSQRVSALRNGAGRAFLADWSTPSTHLLYGYWVGATPDGRGAREMLGYGIDPRIGTVRRDLPARLQSTWKLPFLRMSGGYASHIGVNPQQAAAGDAAGKGLWLRDRIIAPLFRLGEGESETPYYVYFNVDRPENLREVLKSPSRYAPDGVYIVRIHGTFVNFLDLSPAIQQDIMQRLDLMESGRR